MVKGPSFMETRNGLNNWVLPHLEKVLPLILQVISMLLVILKEDLTEIQIWEVNVWIIIKKKHPVLTSFL